MPSERVVWGIPGSGKTNFGTKLSKIWLSRGVKNDEIAYLAFTKAAAKAAAKKILDSEDDARLSDAFPYFRTIHSLSYMGLRKGKQGVRMITPGHMKAFSKASGMDGAYTLYEWEDDMGEVFQKANKGGKTDWDNALAAYTMSRLSASSKAELEIARIQPSAKACSLLGVENLRCEIYQTFVTQYERFKLAEEVIDFTDMLEYALSEMEPLKCRFFIVDECLPAGTRILREDGSTTTIEKVRVGDRVLGYDHAAGGARGATVVERRKRRASRHVRVNNALTLTRNHPVFVVGRGYVEAGRLAVGDRIIVAGRVPHVRESCAAVPKVLPPCMLQADPPRDGLRLEVHLVGSLQEIEADVDVYNIGTTTENYFAEGILVHNCQDLCPLHYAIITKLASNAEEIFWIGDDDQCQPAGTMVWSSKDGKEQAPIESLKEGSEVVSYDRPGAALVAGKKVLQKASRLYSGPLFTVEAGGKKTRATQNHRFIGRWTASARGGNECVTYLMEKDGNWRVGWCQLFNSDKALHFNIRMNNERASRGWILKVHKDRTEASIHESVIAARYGLPTIPFNPVTGATHMTAEAIEKTFREIGPREGQARECLADHGRSAQYPFIDKEKEPERKRSTIFETQACNLIPDLMALPVVAPNQKISWEPLSIEVSEVKGLPVYSLDVERHHTYVADGIVTHNSIYQWSGASANLFLDRAKLARYHIQLRQTHRYGQEIVDFSGRIISRVARRHPKEIIGVQGQGGRVIHSGEFKPVTGDVLIMNRHVHGCQAIADAYIAAGLPFINERGKDPLNAFARVSAWETLNTLAKGESVGMSHASSMIEELMKSVVDGDHGKKVRLVVHGAKAKFENFANERVGLYDLVKANVLTQEGMNVISEREYWTLKHPLDLEYYDRVVKNGYSLEANPEHIPKITTIHGSKGREAKQAIVFSEMSNRCWDDPDSEHRLAYVAATRTQSDLTVCAENTVDWAKSQYHYPFQDEEK